MPCPLCRSEAVVPFATVRSSRYLRCDACLLTYLDPEEWIGPEAERAHYETHENDPADPRYRAFLDRLAQPLVPRLPAGAEGLDYGAGPGPTLSVMLRERGFRMHVYDPFFAPAVSVLRRTYDFITCSETAEHFFSPRTEFDRVYRLLRPSGWLGLMTELLEDDASFPQWYYVRDPTHVCFYRVETLEWIATHYGYALDRPARNVALFQKRAAASPAGV